MNMRSRIMMVLFAGLAVVLGAIEADSTKFVAAAPPLVGSDWDAVCAALVNKMCDVCQCPRDADGYGVVDIDDVVQVVLDFGPCPGT